MLALLMVISTFTPHLAFAAEEVKSFSAEELVIEKQREQEYESRKPLSAPEERNDTGSSELTDLLKGIGIDPPPLSGEPQPEVPEGKTDESLIKAFEKIGRASCWERV